MKQGLIAIFIFIEIIGCTPSSEKNSSAEANPFSGLWSLHVMQQLNPETSDWEEWRNGMQGYILYDNQDNMSVHLTIKDYQDTDLRFPNFTDTISYEALKHLTNSYVYFAKYSVDTEQNIVEHARISHSNPGEWNQIVRRRFSFSGDTLTLQPLETEISGLRLKWVKNE
jgi:hypothetical protein